MSSLQNMGETVRLNSVEKTEFSRCGTSTKIHREREVGLKVCSKCFFTTLEQIYKYYFFCLSHKEEMRGGTEFFTAKRVVSSQQLWSDLFYFIFSHFSSRRNEKRDSFYTAKRVSS
jgi:hypothetical protein